MPKVEPKVDKPETENKKEFSKDKFHIRTAFYVLVFISLCLGVILLCLPIKIYSLLFANAAGSIQLLVIYMTPVVVSRFVAIPLATYYQVFSLQRNLLRYQILNLISVFLVFFIFSKFAPMELALLATSLVSAIVYSLISRDVFRRVKDAKNSEVNCS